MSRATKETLWTVAYIAAGLVAAWLTRLLVFARVASRPSILPFIVLGVAGGLIYAALRLRGLGDAILMVVLLFFLQVALNPPVRAASAIRAVFWALPVGTAFIIAGYIFKTLTRIRFGKFILMALLIGLSHWLVVLLFQLRTPESLPGTIFFSQLIIGALFGALFGLLIETLELFFPHKKAELTPPLP